MMTLGKALVGTIAAGAVAVDSAGAAHAQSRYDRWDRERHDRVDRDDVIAGAVVLGGLAALAGSSSRGYDYRDRGYYGGDPRQAVEQCVAAATRTAERASYGGRARVTDIRDIDRNRDGFTVKGRIAVNTLGRGWRNGDPRYGRGWDNDYRGWSDEYRGWDAGKFTCRVSYGRVVKLDFGGIRGL